MDVTWKVRNVEIAGRRTSMKLEEPFWDAIHDCADQKGLSVQQLINLAVRERGSEKATMASALRSYVISHYVSAARSQSLEKRR